MSVKIYGIKDDGSRDLLGMAPGPTKLLQFAPALNEMIADYPRAAIEDSNMPTSVPLKHHPFNPTEPPPLWANALPIWTVYDHPRDWPTWFVARLFINETPTGSMLLYRKIEPLRDELTRRGLVPMMRSPGDDPVIMETWL